MSCDNYIFININKIPIEVWSCVASQISDNIEDQKITLIGKAKTIGHAIKLAEKYEEELNSEGCCVEYGINFKLWAK